MYGLLEYSDGQVNKQTRGIPKTTYLQVIQTQLKDKHIQTLEDAMIEAKDREKWRGIVQDPSSTTVSEQRYMVVVVDYYRCW